MKKHHRVRLLLLLLSLLLVLGVRALAVQQAMTSAEIRAAADSTRALRVIVSVDQRRVWVVSERGDTLRTAPVAVGTGRRLTAAGKVWRFATPRGVRTVLSTEVDPLWIRPDWAYVELARQKRLRLESISAATPKSLGGGRSLVVRGGVIGVLRDSGVFEPWPAGKDVIIAGVLYLPPPGSSYRAVPGVLGRYRLNLGGSIGFHGTLDKESIGRAATHGCMRLHDDDLEWLFLNVPVGTPVFIY